MPEFINPYNYVPLGKMCNRKELKYGNLTGEIICTLVPKTDIFIPLVNVIEHNSDVPMEFFRYGSYKAVIPGSTLKGVIRSSFETLTNSCMSTLDDKVIASRITSIKKPAVIKKINGQWRLFYAKRILCKKELLEKNQIKTGDKVSFESIDFIKSSGENTKRKIVKSILKSSEKDSFVLIGNPFGNPKSKSGKKYESVFKIISQDYEIINESAVNNLIAIIEDYYANDKINKDEKHNHFIDYKINEEGTPVWYEKIDNKIYLSPACKGRNAYYKTPKDLAGDFKPCDSKKLCSACRIFGTINQENSVSSRVRFCDAVPKNEDDIKIKDKVILKELSLPKPTSMEFYIYNVNKKLKFFTYDTNGSRLRGRKYYWHNKADTIYSTDEKTERNYYIKPLSGDNEPEFKFSIYFEKMFPSELKQLLYVLSIGDNKNENYHKIGLGKPIGLGSVKIMVDKLKIRKVIDFNYDFKETQEYLPYYNGLLNYDEVKELFELSNSDKDDEMLSSYMNISKFDYAFSSNIDICYPYTIDRNGNNRNKNYEWFTENRGSIKNPQYKQQLIKINDINNNEIEYNYAYEISSKDNNFKSKNKKRR